MRADIVVVLGGDPSGNRILKAGELVREGFAPQVLVSGPAGLYGYYECDLAISFAVKKGYPESYFVPFDHDSRSTRDEAEVIVKELRRRGVHSFDLVTSNYHSRRAAATFRDVMGDLRMRVVTAPDPFFSAGAWWRNREGRKTFVIEWMKTVASWLKM